MTKLIKDTKKSHYPIKQAVAAIRYALKMERDGNALLSISGSALSIQMVHEITVEEIEPVVEVEETYEEQATVTADETEETGQAEEPEALPEPTVEPVEDTVIEVTVDWEHAESLETVEALSEYLEGFGFTSKAKSVKGILKAAKKAL